MYGLSPTLAESVYVYDYYMRLVQSITQREKNMRAKGWTDAADALLVLRARLTEVRNLYKKILYNDIANDKFMQTCKNVRGLNGIDVARALMDVNIAYAPTPAALWQFAGLGVEQGHSTGIAWALRIGTKRMHLLTFRRIGRLRQRLLSKKGPYRKDYERRRLYELNRGYSALVSHRRAVRYVTKIWLKHVWIAMRAVHGLPTGDPHEADKTADLLSYGWVLPT